MNKWFQNDFKTIYNLLNITIIFRDNISTLTRKNRSNRINWFHYDKQQNIIEIKNQLNELLFGDELKLGHWYYWYSYFR